MALIDTPGEKLLIRMWQTLTEKGIGGLLRPWQTRREGRAHLDLRREELLILAQAERDAEEIRGGRKQLTAGEGGRVQVTDVDVSGPLELNSVATAVNQQLLVEGVRREVNVAKALVAAEAELIDDTQEPPEQAPNDDWLHRWRDYVGAVSTEQLQGLWGRLLAGEVKAPGTFSLRTLEFIRNLSSEEALQIARLSPFAISGFIFRDKAELNSHGIDFGFFLGMQQLGVISGADGLGLEVTFKTRKVDHFYRALICHNRALIVLAEDPTKQIKLEVYTLTSLGAQVLRLGRFDANESYLRRVGQAICEQGFKVVLVDCEHTSPTQLRFSREETLCEGGEKQS